MSLVQRPYRVSAPNGWTPVELSPGASIAFRLLRAFFVIAEPGDSGVIPVLRHLGSGGQVLGEWLCFNTSGSAIVLNQPARVTISTAPSPALGVAAGANNDGTTEYYGIQIPSDLIILENEKLTLTLLLANDGTGGYTVPTSYGSEIFFTVAVDEPAKKAA